MRMLGTFKTAAEAYRSVLDQVWESPDRTVFPRGIKTREIQNAMFEVWDATAISFVHTGNHDRDEVVREYTSKERRLYLAQETSAHEWATQASKFWAHLANPDGTINSNYWQLLNGELSAPLTWERAEEMRDEGETAGLMTQLGWVVKTLLLDEHSRQAFAHVSLPRHQWIGNKDQPCTMHLNFAIREGRLHMTSVMRSQDVVKGLTYDMTFFLEVKRWVLLALRAGADPLNDNCSLQAVSYRNLEHGTYTAFVHSLHAYEKDAFTIDRILNERDY